MKLLRCLCSAAFFTLAPQSATSSDLTNAKDGTLIVLRGDVKEAYDNFFVLDYTSGLITVEMDDRDPYREGTNISARDRVTVLGRVDNDTFDNARIEAKSVYVESVDRYFHASGVDDEDIGFRKLFSEADVLGRVYLIGQVSSIGDGHFTIDTGPREVSIDTQRMRRNPFTDDDGIDVGDRVKVSASMDERAFSTRKLAAESVQRINSEAER